MQSLDRIENRTVKVASSYEAAKIKEMEIFLWSLQERKHIDLEADAYGAISRFGNQLIKVKTSSYVQLEFVRNLDNTNANKINQIEKEYLSLSFPTPPKIGYPIAYLSFWAIAFALMFFGEHSGYLILSYLLLSGYLTLLIPVLVSIGILWTVWAFNKRNRVKAISLMSERRAQELKAQARTLRVNMGDKLAKAGRGSEAAQTYLLAADCAQAGEAVELQRRAAEQYLHSGHIDDGMKVLRNVLSQVGMKMPETPWRALFSLIISRAWVRLRGLKFQERSEEKISPKLLVRIDTCWSVAVGLALVDTVRGADFQARHLLLALKSGEPYRIARALALEAGYAAAAGGPGRARKEQLVEMSRAMAVKIGSPHALALAKLAGGMGAYMLGEWNKGLEFCEQSEKVLREHHVGGVWELDTSLLYGLRSRYWLGDINGIASRLPAFFHDAQARNDRYAEAHMHTRVAYFTTLAADEPEKARQDIRQSMARWTNKGFHLQHFSAMLAEAEIDFYSGDYQNAWLTICKQWPSLENSHILRIQVLRLEAYYVRARAALAMATSGTAGSNHLAIAEQDIKRIEREKMAWSDPLAGMLRAGIAILQGKSDEAISCLEKAETDFNATNMSFHAAAVCRRRGYLIGENAGQALIDKSNNWLGTQNVKKIDSLLAVLAPGKWV